MVWRNIAHLADERHLCSILLSIVMLIIALLPGLSWSNVIPLPNSPRQTLSLNGRWSVTGAYTATTVMVPTTIPFTADVTTWIRRFDLALSAPAVAFLEFGGIVNEAVVRLNGVLLGPLLAFTATRFDVASRLVPHGPNVLEVVIDARQTETSVPGGRTSLLFPELGDAAYQAAVAWDNRPGIIRDVLLVYANGPLIDAMFASSTLSGDLTKAVVDIRVRVRTESMRTRTGSSQAMIASVGLRRAGHYIAGCYTPVFQRGEATCRISLERPALWSPDSPALYEVWITLYTAAGLVDAAFDRIGMRKIETRGNQMYLNNQPLFVRGVTRHDIYPTTHFVANPQRIDTELTRIKSLGANLLRAIHYPPAPVVARKADELGLLLTEEIPAWALLNNRGVKDKALAMVRAMIERDYNRPSVILWFTGNGDLASSYYADAIPLVKALDPWRLTSFIFDDVDGKPSFQAQILERVRVARASGFDVYCMNTWTSQLVLDNIMPNLPADFPVMFTEWEGSEGSDRGPLGGTAVKIILA